jgi:hypothetical protein
MLGLAGSARPLAIARRWDPLLEPAGNCPRQSLPPFGCHLRIEKAQALARYSRPGNPYDNAQAEAGWRTLKTELLPRGGAFTTLEEARLKVAYYLDI